jgi:hypothetical protein
VRPDKIYGLGEALQHWLSFQILCGREALLSESYLNQPTGEYLLHAAGSSHLMTEYCQPILNKPGKKGGPRQIDFCLLSRDSQQLTTAIELKLIAKSTLYKQRIIDDLLRLESLLKENTGQHIFRYLIVAGQPNDLKENLFESMMNSVRGRTSFIQGILGTEQNELVKVRYDALAKEQRALFQNFEKKYEAPIPKSFATSLVYGNQNKDIGVYCWRILGSKNRRIVDRATDCGSASTADPT